MLILKRDINDINNKLALGDAEAQCYVTMMSQ